MKPFDTTHNIDTTAAVHWALPIQDIEGLLSTDAEGGLSGTEAAARLKQYGGNALVERKRRGLLAKFFSQFKSFMIIILLGAAVIAGITGYMTGEGFADPLIILAIVLVNACIGTAQEAKAENALEALEDMAAPHCTVVRNGQRQEIAARGLVPGDLVMLEAGDLVPADMRLVEAANLTIQEAALTGESMPEPKHTEPLGQDTPLADRENMAFSSGIVTYGRGSGIVTATGMRTELGKIADMLQAVPDTQTPLQIKIDRMGRFLGTAALSICVLVFAAGFFQGREVLSMFMIAVSLAVAAIPEGLPAVATVALAMGMQRLAGKKAIVRHLPAVETLGSTTVICSDKTGTLTQNKMTVVSMFTDGRAMDISAEAAQETGDEQRRLLLAGVMANDGTVHSTPEGVHFAGDPTETALLELGLRFGLHKEDLEDQFPREAEVPFDSERKMMSTVNRESSGGFTLFVKGGPDEVLARCTSILLHGKAEPLDEAVRESIRAENQDMAKGALRVLATAYKSLAALPETIDNATLETGLIFCGLFGLMDPPREEARAAVAICRAAGIRPVMITGDHMITALAVAEKLGIAQPGDAVLSGADLEALPESALAARVGHTAVYARVAPEHKVRIVQALQTQGAVVAMTGDGVNDAPALKLADIGVAMGVTGTDVARQAADIVLADDNFATIVTAVEEGRRIYDNILKAVQFLLSTNIGEVLVISIAIFANWTTPLLPVHILWINLVTDSLPALALSIDPAGSGIMQRPPIDARKGILQGGFLLRIVLQGALIAFLSLTAFHIGMQSNPATAQTMTFAVLAFAQIAHALNVRSARESAFAGLGSNMYLLGALGLVFIAMVAVLELPVLHSLFHLTALSVDQWLWVIVLSCAPLPIVEAVKLVLRTMRK